MKRVKRLIVFIACLFLSVINVKANTISNIEMDVYIDNDGNASITEVWKTHLNKGTEGYRAFKLNNQEIINFTVKDDSGVQYQNVTNWNTNDSFTNKAYKCGINDMFDEIELCWGISKYGSRTYTLSYNISNFVTQYTDTQGIYFNFINLDQVVNSAKITIRSDKKFSLDNARIWAFGNNGTINFENNNIVLNSNGKLSSLQYMVALVRFENNIFNTNNKSSKSFDNIYDEAMSDVNELKDIEAANKKKKIINIVVNSTVAVCIVLALIKVKKSRFVIVNSTSGFNNTGGTIVTKKITKYCREIPCDKDLNYAYWLCNEYNIVSSEVLNQGIIGAILLKWIKQKKVTVIEKEDALLNINKYAINLSNIVSGDNEIENALLEILKEASDHNGILEAKEFGKWCEDNYYKLKLWYATLNSSQKQKLVDSGLIVQNNKEYVMASGRKVMIPMNTENFKIIKDATNLKGLKKFLLDFSIMPEREYKEVDLWEEYLIFAHLLGIADKVEEQFKNLYPQFMETSSFKMGSTTNMVRDISHRGYTNSIKAERISKQEAERTKNYDRDFGGGGSSYSGGGSSSSGSSGGGFR